MPSTPERLRAALASLPLHVEEARCTTIAIDLPSYPDGPRPSALVTLEGGGHAGRGEHVGWTIEAHAAFADRVAAVARGRGRLGDWVATLADLPPYDRAALEAAAVDLALRQAATTLGELAEVPSRPVRYVVSFGRVADPVREARNHGDVELKVDVDPAWSDDTLATLALARRVAVVDWKGGGTPVDHERAHRALPGALIEDPAPGAAPWSPSLRQRLAADAALTSAAALDAVSTAPVAANLKPARMGGVLELLTCAARCADRGIAVYVGGMFEVDVGRRQLGALAGVLSPDGPNDIAPIARADAEAPVERPTRLVVSYDAPGFGA